MAAAIPFIGPAVAIGTSIFGQKKADDRCQSGTGTTATVSKSGVWSSE